MTQKLSNEALKAHYEQVYANGSQNYYTFSSFDESYEILKYLKGLNGKRVLEIGCGEGGLAAMIAQSGGNVIAVDYSDEVIGIASRKYSMENLKFVATDFKNIEGKFDVVVLQGVLEHFDDPWASLDWIIGNLLEDDGYVVNSCPSFLNPRGYVWMTLQLLLDVPMSLSDLHFLCPFDFEDFCESRGLSMEYSSSNQSWGNGEGMIVDFHKRLRNALRDAGLDNSRVDSLLLWLDKAKAYSSEDAHTGANVIYRIRRI